MDSCSDKNIVVIKLGGSVLPNEESYRHAARFLVRRLYKCAREHLLVVVSAQYGHTDQLELLARSVTASPNSRTLDLLWSTGELRSVALLTLHLQELGVAAVALNAHEAGLRLNQIDNGHGVQALSVELRRAFSDHSIAVVPGFFATLTSGTLVSLGRGGSDLTAVLLAVELSAVRCELVKDVPGYFTADPHVDGTAQHIPALSFEKALQLADAGCDLVQRRAVEVASETNLPLVVQNLTEEDPNSIVSAAKGSQVTPDAR
jgi:aspartate kinase